MDEEQLNRICQVVREFLGANPGRHVAWTAEVESLIEHTRGRVAGVEEAPLYVASLMSALGPRIGAPPLTVFRELSEIAAREVGGDLDRIKEVVIAYGCGKWRRLRADADPWDDQWERAFLALVEALAVPVREVNEWLSRNLVGYEPRGYWRTKEGEDDIRSDAGRLAVHLIQPVEPLHLGESGELLIVCEDDGVRIRTAGARDADWLPFGAKAVFEVQATTLSVRRNDGAEERHALTAGALVNVLAVENLAKLRLPPFPTVSMGIGEVCGVSGTGMIARRACACGNCNCATRHRMESWDPKQYSLWSFLAAAVKGPDREIKAGTLAEGMYLPILGKDGTGRGLRLRMVLVEYKLCSGPDCPGADPEHKYEGDRCPSCKRVYDPRTTLRRAYRRLIVVGGNAPPYERVARYRCTAEVKRNGRIEDCGNLYEADKCPICGSRPTTRRPTIVWVRTFNKSEPLDDHVGALPLSLEDGPCEEGDGDDDAPRRARKARKRRKQGKRR